MTRNKKIALGAGTVVLVLAALGSTQVPSNAPTSSATPSVVALVPSQSVAAEPATTPEPTPDATFVSSCGDDSDCLLAELAEMLCEDTPIAADWKADGLCADGNPVASAEPEGPTQYAVGDTVTVTSNDEPWAEIRVSDVKQVKRYEGDFGFDDVPAKGNIYIQLKVTYVALINGVDYNPFDWQVFAGGEAVGDYTFVSNGPTPPLESGSLPKGRKASGWLVYEVPVKGEVLFSYGGTFSNDEPVFEVVLRGDR